MRKCLILVTLFAMIFAAGCGSEESPASSEPETPVTQTTMTAEKPTESQEEFEAIDSTLNGYLNNTSGYKLRSDLVIVGDQGEVCWYINVDIVYEHHHWERADQLYRETATEHPVLVREGHLGELQASGDTLYFSEYIQNKGYVIQRLQDEQITMVTCIDSAEEHSSDYLQFKLYGNDCYYLDPRDNGIYRISLDGGDAVPVCIPGTGANEVPVPTGFCVYRDRIYFVSLREIDGISETYNLWQMELDGSDVNMVAALESCCFNLAGEYMYYTADDGILYRQSIEDDADKTVMFTYFPVSDLKIFEGYGYTTHHLNFKIWLDGSKRRETIDFLPGMVG